MKMQVREQVKTLLSQENITMKELARRMGESLDKDYSLQTISHRLRRGTVYYNEVLAIADILGYNIKFEKKNK